jgi:hypothetical protein
VKQRNSEMSPWARRDGHGSLRGADVLHQSSTFEGRFGRMFRTLPPAHFDDEDLVRLGTAGRADGDSLQGMSAAPEVLRDQSGKPMKDSKTGFLIPRATHESELDDEENLGIPAGYTYLGQFIDHDITFDPASSLDKQNDPEALIDFRTPRLDLDSLYGRGPDDQPYLYDTEDPRKFVLGRALTQGGRPSASRDLPRFERKVALIGDKRNDENVIVSQLHGAFLKFHNEVVDRSGANALFDEVQRDVRWHYQWLVVHDFLPRIVGQTVMDDFLAEVTSNYPISRNALRLFSWRNEPFIPIEFAAAAYRFGHSMVRPIYRLNTKLGEDATPDERDRGVDGRRFIFAATQAEGLNGFREFPTEWAIDWSLFFELKSPPKNDPENHGRVQPAYKIDTSLVNPLAFLPEFSKKRDKEGNLVQDADGHPERKDNDESNLVLRNLRRGKAMGLPSGQSVARYLGLDPLPDDKLRVGKANADSLKPEGQNQNRSITDFGVSFCGNAPLWFYVLAEAKHQWTQVASALQTDDERNRVPTRLGPVGGRIVMEVLVGLLLGDRHSYLSQDPRWTPKYGKNGDFTMRDLIEVAGLA